MIVCERKIFYRVIFRKMIPWDSLVNFTVKFIARSIWEFIYLRPPSKGLAKVFTVMLSRYVIRLSLLPLLTYSSRLFKIRNVPFTFTPSVLRMSSSIGRINDPQIVSNESAFVDYSSITIEDNYFLNSFMGDQQNEANQLLEQTISGSPNQSTTSNEPTSKRKRNGNSIFKKLKRKGVLDQSSGRDTDNDEYSMDGDSLEKRTHRKASKTEKITSTVADIHITSPCSKISIPGYPVVDILYEDSEIIVINKPSGMLSVPGNIDEKPVLKPPR